jgi:iron complex outermembrane receptor protein
MRALTFKHVLCASGAVLALSLPAAAWAQATDGAIEEVVVTARKRAESLQDVPVTVTAFEGAALQEKGIVDFQRLADATPGVTIDAFPRAAPRPFFRGIGSSNQSAGADPSSVAFIDGVYIGRGPMLAVDIFDMERVEVLKGPQGTLWGKNVVGGAVNFVTAKPVQDFEGQLQLTAGDFGQKNGSLMLNAPLAENLAARVALSSTKNDGFRKTPGGTPLDDDDRLSGRLHVLFQVAEDTDLLFTADGTKDRMSGGSRYNLKPFGYQNVDKPRYANPDRPGYIDRDTGGLKLELNSGWPGFARLTGIASWRTLDYDSSEDLDGTNAAQNLANGVATTGVQTLQTEKADSYSTEWRLASTGDGPVSWVAGVYYLRDEVYRERESETEAVDNSENRFVANNVTKSFAAFGEAEYGFDNGLNLFAGLRFTDEKKAYDVTRLVGNPAAPTVNYSTVGDPGRTHEQMVTWRVGGDWRFNQHVFAFGSVATGFKSGAFQEQPSAATARNATDPEKVVNYEAGLKTDWLDRRLRLNASIFYAEYSDLQTIQAVPDATQGPAGSRIVTDTGDATIKGLESELIFAPTRNIDLSASYTYLDATFDRFTQTSRILADGSAVAADLKGNRLSRTPKHAATLDAAYTTDPFSWGWLKAQVSANYESEVFDDNANDFIEYRKARTLWDASLTWFLKDEVSLQAWVRNLTDVEYRTHQVETAGGHFVQYGPPRQAGVTLNVLF